MSRRTARYRPHAADPTGWGRGEKDDAWGPGAASTPAGRATDARSRPNRDRGRNSPDWTQFRGDEREFICEIVADLARRDLLLGELSDAGVFVRELLVRMNRRRRRWRRGVFTAVVVIQAELFAVFMARLTLARPVPTQAPDRPPAAFAGGGGGQ